MKCLEGKIKLTKGVLKMEIKGFQGYLVLENLLIILVTCIEYGIREATFVQSHTQQSYMNSSLFRMWRLNVGFSLKKLLMSVAHLAGSFKWTKWFPSTSTNSKTLQFRRYISIAASQTSLGSYHDASFAFRINVAQQSLFIIALHCSLLKRKMLGLRSRRSLVKKY